MKKIDYMRGLSADKPNSRPILLRLGVLFTFLLWIGISTSVQAQENVTLSVQGKTISEVFQQIEKQTHYAFLFDEGVKPELQKKVTINLSGKTIRSAMTELLKGTNLQFQVSDRQVLVFKKQANAISGEPEQITGTVVDESGEALIGATIAVKRANGETSYTTTSSDGTYHLAQTGDEVSITASYIGYEKSTVKVKAGSNKTDYPFVLRTSVEGMDEVVVTGYATINRSQYVGAINQVKADDIKIASEASIDQMLQGVVPGMSVVNTTGKVGGTPKIRIRGTSTLLGNQEPLWVVDNVIQTNPTPIPNDASPLSSDMSEMLETAGNAISWLNPADIETITVLKDASATAIYGSQASNGVIVITTKKGKQTQGGIEVSYSGNLSITQKPTYGLYDMMNSQQYMNFSQQLYQDRDSYTQEILPVGYAGLLQQLQDKTITKDQFNEQFRKMENMNTDWFDLLFRTPVSTSHNVTFSTGNDKVQSRVSLGYNSTIGEAKGNDMTAFTASTNTTFRPSSKLVIDFSMNGTFRKTDDFYAGVSPYEYAMNTSRALPMYNDDGSLYYYQTYGNTSYAISNKHFYNYNIQNEIDNTGTTSTTNMFQAALSLKWDVVKHLQLQGDASLNISSNKMKSYATEYSNFITQLRGYEIGEVQPNSEAELSSPLPYGGLLNTNDQNTKNYSFRGSMVYSNVFNEKHNVTFNLGIQLTSIKTDGNTSLRYGYLKYRGETFATVPDKSDLHHTTGYTSSTDYHEAMRQGSSVVNTLSNTLSEYFTAVYSYDNRYVFNLNGRLDASNRFGQDENHRFNPSISLGAKWRIGEEPWMDWAHDWYDMFDLSFSYGWRGNAVSAVSPYLIAKDGGIHTYLKQYYLTVVSLPYPDLGWEKTRDWNLGVDFSFFDGRLSAGFNYYSKNSKVLSSQEVGPEYGVSSAYIDGTVMKNYGYEFIISTTPVRTKDWTWSLSFNTSKDYNRVENNELVNTPSDYLSGTAIVEDKPYGTIYAYDFAGLDPTNGQPTFNGLSKETTPVDFKDYLVEAGCTEPDVSGGISTSIRYKNFHLRAQFAMSLGAQAYLPEYFATSGAPRPEKNVPTYMFDRWRTSGDETRTDIPSIPAGNPNDLYVDLKYGKSTYSTSLYEMYNKSTARIADTDFIRCRNISLQYDVDKDFTSRLGIRNAYVTLSLTNPFFIAFDSKWDGRDPETASWPARRSLSLSLNLTF